MVMFIMFLMFIMFMIIIITILSITTLIIRTTFEELKTQSGSRVSG